MIRSSRPAFLVLLLALGACQRESAPTPAPAPAPAAASSGNAVTVEIALSPAARARLASSKESLIVSADYFGYPSADAVARRVPGSGNPWLTVHRAQVELEGVQLDGMPTARLPNVDFDAKQLAWTDAPAAPQVNINVWSGRRSSSDNLLDCTMFQGALAIASRAPIRLSCGLIGETSR